MRQFVVDQLSKAEHERIKKYLQTRLRPGGLEGMFWLELPEALLDEEQKSHQGCAPFNFAFELNNKQLCCELLLRGSGRIHCPCTKYALKNQRDFLFDFIDKLLKEKQIVA